MARAMSRTEAQKRAQKKYELSGAVRQKTKGYHIKCHIEHDADVIAALDAQENKNGYIKTLIRNDIKKSPDKL